MLKFGAKEIDRGDKLGLLDRWLSQAKDDPQASLEDRLTRSALSAVAMDDPINQDAVLGLLTRRGVPQNRFAAMQTVLCNTSLHEDFRRLEIEKLLSVGG